MKYRGYSRITSRIISSVMLITSNSLPSRGFPLLFMCSSALFLGMAVIFASSFPYHRLISVSLREMKFTMNSSTTLITVLNRPIAAEKLYLPPSRPRSYT